jgi:hypothetical protein
MVPTVDAMPLPFLVVAPLPKLVVSVVEELPTLVVSMAIAIEIRMPPPMLAGPENTIIPSIVAVPPPLPVMVLLP